MRRIHRVTGLLCLGLLVSLGATGCSDACDDLEEACDRCDSSSCRSTLSICDIYSGPPRTDCCDNALDGWDEC